MLGHILQKMVTVLRGGGGGGVPFSYTQAR